MRELAGNIPDTETSPEILTLIFLGPSVRARQNRHTQNILLINCNADVTRNLSTKGAFRAVLCLEINQIARFPEALAAT